MARAGSIAVSSGSEDAAPSSARGAAKKAGGTRKSKSKRGEEDEVEEVIDEPHQDGDEVIQIRDDDADEGEEEDEEEDEEPEEEYEIEKIMRHRSNKKNGAIDYFIKWKGYSADDNTWEPEANVKETAPEMVAQYWKSAPGAKAEPRKYLSPSKAATAALAGAKRKRSAGAGAGGADAEAGAEEQALTKEEKEAAEYQEAIRKEKERYLALDSWDDICKCETMERGDDGVLVALMKFDKCKYELDLPAQECYKRAPQKMLAFYEAHLRFKTPTPATAKKSKK